MLACLTIVSLPKTLFWLSVFFCAVSIKDNFYHFILKFIYSAQFNFTHSVFSVIQWDFVLSKWPSYYNSDYFIKVVLLKSNHLVRFHCGLNISSLIMWHYWSSDAQLLSEIFPCHQWWCLVQNAFWLCMLLCIVALISVVHVIFQIKLVHSELC